MKKLVILFGVAMMLLTSCAKEDSANVEQDSIYSIYTLVYKQKEAKTTASATFRFGGATGTLLELKDPASATFESDLLLYNGLTGEHKKEYAGIVKSGSFMYTNTDGNVYKNTTRVMDTIAFPTIDTIDASMAYDFSWVGNPLASGETISLTIDGTQQQNFEIFSTIVPAKTNLILGTDKLQKLGHGLATCVLRREHNRFTVDEGTSKGGRMAVVYTTEKQVFIKQ
ncbi:MAG: hypothetical protein JXR19_03275 [Bacteroidia bacterium]